MISKRWIIGVLSTLTLLLMGCQAPSEIDLPVTIPALSSPSPAPIEPTPVPPEKTLIVCLAQEPESLFIYSQAYLYGGAGREANAILESIYDGPFDVLEEGIVPIILETLPTLESGTVRYSPVEVNEYEVYLNPATLQPENLRWGKVYLPSGCHNSTCAKTYEGGPVVMDRMQVDFALRGDISWSDGVSLTAVDSEFSFELDRDGSSPTTKYLADRTHSYDTVGDFELQWTGIPGYSDLDYQTLFWHPLPRHILGEISEELLQEHEGANKSPVGWGPYQMDSWTEGDRIEVVRNPYYFRQEEFPYFDRIVYRFLNSEPRAALQQIFTSECDVLDESLLSQDIWPDLVALAEEGNLQLLSTPAAEIMRLEFNTAPIGRAGEAYFQTVEMRQAVAACLDRERLGEGFLAGLSTVPMSYHTFKGLEGQDESTLEYNPEHGKELIRFLGWVDDDEDPTTPHSGWGVTGVYNAKRLVVSMLIPDREPYPSLADEIQTMLFECGIHVEIETATAEELTESYPGGLVFGRDFDMALWSWPDWRTPLCEMFATRELPTDTLPFGVNASGFSNQVYDASCDALLLGELEDAEMSVATVQEIFLDQLPALPILQPPRLLAMGPELCGFEMDALAPSNFWRIEYVARDDGCR